MPAKKKTAPKKQKSFEDSLWDTATKLRGSVESSDWSGATKASRQGCPEGGRGGAHQNGVAGFDSVHLRFAPVVLANGPASAGSTNTKGEGEIRRKMVKNDLVDCMIALPGQLFYTTQIPVCLWFLTKNKKGSVGVPPASSKNSSGQDGRAPLRDRRGETLFIDARKIGSMISRTQKEFGVEDVAAIAKTYHSWRGQGSVGVSPASSDKLPRSKEVSSVRASHSKRRPKLAISAFL